MERAEHEPLGTDLPDGARFIGAATIETEGAWRDDRAVPTITDLQTCVACGLCLPHCPTYRLTGEESASPRGRIASMRVVQAGHDIDPSFSAFMDLCLACRACEDVCPSHVPFGRMMEAAREQIEPKRTRRSRMIRWLGFHWVLPHPSVLRVATALQPVARPFLPRRVRAALPRRARPFVRLPRVSEPPPGVAVRGTVDLLAGCVQDRWFHEVNLATIEVLTRAGWRVRVPRGQACCGALPAHNGRLAIARRLATRAAHAFRGADAVVVNAAGCSAHMKSYGELLPGTELPVRDAMEFLFQEGLRDTELHPVRMTVAYHDACHALRVQHVGWQPRAVLAKIPELAVVDIPDGDRCCGAAGIYTVTQPVMASALGRQKAEAIASTGATVVASANPGCSLQLAAHADGVQIMHPIELLASALRG
jgi:glycolate oxidase iron-sulfur subunit